VQDTPRANRLHITFLGKTNSGKSTIVNNLAGQEISIVSPEKGTTTDPVFKAMELLPLGPVVLVDTAGFSDDTALGQKRMEKTLEAIKKTDLAVLVVSSLQNEFSEEERYIKILSENKVKTVLLLNVFEKENTLPFDLPTLKIDGKNPDEMGKLKKFIIENAPTDFEIPSLTSHLVKKGDLVILVAPQDIEAPKGRLILPQVQTIRDLLDNNCKTLVIKPDDLKDTLEMLKTPPSLVVVDSQVFKEVNEVLPKEIPLTSFSVLMSKNKGDIDTFKSGAMVLSKLKPGDRVLIMESCTHHSLPDDIARGKLPKLLNKYVGGELKIDFFAGQGFPKNIGGYKLILHCGGCMLNRKNMLSKITEAENLGVPITNFGMAIAYMNGIFDRIEF